jgi:hypothetical protein
MRVVLSGLAWGLLFAATWASAHDTWLLPDRFAMPSGGTLTATLSAGDGLKPLNPPKQKRVKSLELVDAEGRRPYLAWKDRKTSARITFPSPRAGVSCLAYSTVDIDIVIAPKLVDAYLAEIQPAPEVLQAWARQRAAGEPWRERYAKDAKTCLRAGGGDAGWPQLAVLGQTLEFVPTQDPTRLKRGDRIEVELRHLGRPLADTAVRLFAGEHDETVLRTDGQGRVAFDLPRSGRHLLATTRLDLPAAPGAPWTSRFATLGFGVAD